jgi:hypothetical protein
MNFDLVFQLSSLLVMPFWLLMVFLPTWRWTQRIIVSPWIAAPAALLYALLIVPMMAAALPALMNPELANISSLLGTPEGATVGWIHFLAFDLFVGRWVYLDGRRLGLSAWLVSPILLAVLMFGPLGLLIYLVVGKLPRSSRSNSDIRTEVQSTVN